MTSSLPEQTIYLTTHEVALRFRIHPKTLFRWLAQKNPKYPTPLKIGNRLRWPIKEIERYERSCKHKSGQPWSGVE